MSRLEERQWEPSSWFNLLNEILGETSNRPAGPENLELLIRELAPYSTLSEWVN
jgi:hypothetical protein